MARQCNETSAFVPIPDVQATPPPPPQVAEHGTSAPPGYNEPMYDSNGREVAPFHHSSFWSVLWGSAFFISAIRTAISTYECPNWWWKVRDETVGLNQPPPVVISDEFQTMFRPDKAGGLQVYSGEWPNGEPVTLKGTVFRIHPGTVVSLDAVPDDSSAACLHTKAKGYISTCGVPMMLRGSPQVGHEACTFMQTMKTNPLTPLMLTASTTGASL